MKFFDRHTWELLRHTATNFLIAIVLCALAIGLDALEHWSAAHGVSPWLVTGIGFLAKVTFIFDGVLFLATMGMVGAHFVREYFNRLFRR